MNKTLLFHIMGILWTLAGGSLLHFAYEQLGRKRAVSWFAPINESVWEHMKLLFFPVLFWSFTEYFTYGKTLPGFWAGKTIALLVGCLLIPLLYYGYTGFLGRHFLWADIGVFALSVLAVYGLSFTLTGRMRCLTSLPWQIFFLALTAGMTGSFIRFTEKAPDLPLFRDHGGKK